MKHFAPFANETQTLAVADLTVENRIDSVALYGSIDITRDHAGLANALELQSLIDAVVKALQADPQLPLAIPIAPVKTVSNPFAS